LTLLLLLQGCKINLDTFPYISYPYLAKLTFHKHISNQNGNLTFTDFDKETGIQSPFYFLLKIKEIENNGSVRVVFYNKKSRKVDQKEFQFGEKGKYYEYIIFFDKVEFLPPGTYSYAVFLNRSLLYEDKVTISY
jgi:hypothetical protein